MEVLADRCADLRRHLSVHVRSSSTRQPLNHNCRERRSARGVALAARAPHPVNAARVECCRLHICRVHHIIYIKMHINAARHAMYTCTGGAVSKGDSILPGGEIECRVESVLFFVFDFVVFEKRVYQGGSLLSTACKSTITISGSAPVFSRGSNVSEALRLY